MPCNTAAFTTSALTTSSTMSRSTEVPSVIDVGLGRIEEQPVDAAEKHRAEAEPDRQPNCAGDHREPSAGTVTVTVCGSDEALTSGTYIGATCAGTARNSPDEIAFTR